MILAKENHSHPTNHCPEKCCRAQSVGLLDWLISNYWQVVVWLGVSRCRHRTSSSNQRWEDGGDWTTGVSSPSGQTISTTWPVSSWDESWSIIWAVTSPAYTTIHTETGLFSLRVLGIFSNEKFCHFSILLSLLWDTYLPTELGGDLNNPRAKCVEFSTVNREGAKQHAKGKNCNCYQTWTKLYSPFNSFCSTLIT